MERRFPRRALLGAGLAGLASLAACGQVPASVSHALATALPSATPLPTVTPSPTPIPRPVTVAITGDIMLSRAVGTRMVAAGSSGLFPFERTAEFLRGFDLTVGNLECVVSRVGAPVPNKPFTFRADPLGFARLQAAGFDLVSVANNHSGDYGPVAFADMLAHLPGAGVQFVGGGLNHDAAHAPTVVERGGTRLAFVAACDIDPVSFAATATQPGHAWLDATGLRRDIPLARAQGDLVIVFLHWGLEYITQYDGLQQGLAHLAIDLGADLVVGAHPHVIQPTEVYKGKPIIYSLGNFVFDEMFDAEAHGNILTFQARGNQILDWKLVPITIDTATGAPYLA